MIATPSYHHLEAKLIGNYEVLKTVKARVRQAPWKIGTVAEGATLLE